MNQEQLNNIASYLDKFESGELAHDQKTIHSNCGSSHCMAGWRVFDLAVADGVVPTWRSRFVSEGHGVDDSISSEIQVWCKEKFGTYDEMQAAAHSWGLYSYEADCFLFDPTLTLVEMRKNLLSLASLYKLETP